MADSSAKAIKVIPLTAETVFEKFESLTLIDSGATDGFQIAGTDGVYGAIPTGIVVNIGGPGPRACEKITVKAASGKTLACTAILYS